MRGERSVAPNWRQYLTGSSPHARGTQVGKVAHDHIARFIPACAGNARHPASIRSWTTVHPRMRGERGSVCCTALMFSGSSPHARGTPKEVRDYAVNKRFIPACAGNAAWRTLPPHGPSVHPRMRGERAKGLFPGAAKTGSSPHARGTLRFGQPHACGQRFIPACAGNAHRERREREHHAVHPRMRGERARRGARRGVGRRFIPACAGNARLIIRRSSWPAVHPRMRGERNLSPTPMPSPTGSSPHARGTLQGRK